MHRRPDGRATNLHQDMRVEVAAEQHGLEEHHGDRPHRGRAAENGQDHAREHRLHGEQQKSAGEDGGREYGEDQPGMRRGRDGLRPGRLIDGHANLARKGWRCRHAQLSNAGAFRQASGIDADTMTS